MIFNQAYKTFKIHLTTFYILPEPIMHLNGGIYNVKQNNGSESFPDFVRTHWNSRQKFVRHTDLFEAIRTSVTTREQAFELLRAMEEDLDTYLFLLSPESSDWPPELKKHATNLRMFNVKQPFALLLAARRHWEPRDFATILRACMVISFRYNVIGNRPTNEQERSYNSAAAAVSQETGRTPKEIWLLLNDIYPSDDQFRAMFSDKIIRTTQSRNRKIVRYILCSIEHHISEGFDAPINFRFFCKFPKGFGNAILIKLSPQ